MPSTADSGPLTFDRLRDLWHEVVATFTGMDAALLRPTNPVALEGGRLAVDCSVTFRRDRLQERNAASRIGDEIERRTGQRIRVDFVVQDRDGVTLSAPVADPPGPSPAASPEPTPDKQESQAPRSDSAPPDERPFEPEAPKVPAEANEPATADVTEEEPRADLEAFFEAADISVTEVKEPSGPSLF